MMSDIEQMDQATARYAHIRPEAWIEDRGSFRVKDMGDYFVEVIPFMFTAAIVIVPNMRGLIGYDDRWCYHSVQDALKAADAWDGQGWPGAEPQGWHRHPSSGRRRDGGDPTKERIQR